MSGIQSIRSGLTGNITKVIVIAIIITFIGSVGWAGFFSQGSANIIAKVGSQDITTADLSFEVSTQQFSLSQRFPDQEIEDEIIINLSKDVLIDKFTILDFLYENNISLTDDFVYKALSDEEQFQENGRFSKNRFDAFARSNGFIPTDYLKRVKEDFLLSIWNQSFALSSFVTENEVEQSIRLAEQGRDVSFVRIPRSFFEESIVYEDSDLVEFYEANKASYTSPEKAKITFISIASEDLKKGITLSDEEIESEYKEYFEGFDRTERKSVSHIMLNINDSRNIEQALQDLEQIKNKLDQGESFEELVLEYSEDSGTKETGGSLGVTDGTLLPPEFEDALSNMSAGEVKGPIELLDSVHLLKLDEIIQPEAETLEQRSPRIRENLVNIKAEEAYVELLDQISDMAFNSSDVETISKDLDLSMVETDFLSQQDLPETLKTKSVEDYIFNDSFDNTYPEVIETSELSAVLIKVEDFLQQKQLSFEEVRSDIENSYVSEEIRIISADFGSKTLADLEGGLTIEDFSAQQGINLETYANIKRDSSLLPVQAVNQIFALPKSQSGDVFGYSLAQNGDGFVYRLDSVQTGTRILADEERQSVTDFLNQQSTITELNELQTYLEENISVQRIN